MDEQIYTGLGIIDGDSVKKEIEQCEKKASPFSISCSENDGAWGIWLKIGDDLLLVNPRALVNSLLTDGVQDGFFLDFRGNNKGLFTFSTCREKYHINANLGHFKLNETSQQRFMFEEYVNKSQQAIIDLLRAAEEGKTLAYEPKVADIDIIRVCANQMEIKAVLPSYYRLRSQDVDVEAFEFEPLENKWCENYRIAIGNRGYDTWLSHYDNDMERIRHELETYVFEREAVIKLSHDLSYTIIKLNKATAIEGIKRFESGGIGFDYKHYIEVQLEPNEFINMPIIKGLCDEKKMIRSFYEGLLKLAMLHPETSDDIDLPCWRVMYNKFKSPIIEAFLRDEYTKDDEYALRQVHVKHIITICPDFDYFLMDEEKVSLDLESLYSSDGKPISLHAFEEWQEEISDIVVKAATGKEYDKDWQDYHRRGLELAKQLRSMLSTDFDLWYDAPYEDKSGIISKPILII